MHSESRQKAFTLIELLIVVAIIALLLSISIPALRRAKEAGRVVVCKSTLRGLTAAHYMYYTLHKRLLPISTQLKRDNDEMRPWFVLDDYRSLLDLPPLAERYKKRHWPDWQEYKPSYPKKYICPSAKVALNSAEEGLYAMNRSYGLNSHVYYFEDYVKMRLNSQSGSILAMADAMDWWFNCWQCDVYTQHGEQWLIFDTYGSAAYRHNHKANTAFWDGHVEQMTAEQLKAHLMEWVELEQRRSMR